MIRFRAFALVLLLVTIPLAACSDDDDDPTGGDDPLVALVGTWSTTAFVYTADADPSTTIDIFDIANLGIQSITVNADGSFTGSLVLPGPTGEPQEIPLTGSLTNVTSTSLTIDFTGASEQALGDSLDATYSVSGDVLTIEAEDVTFDFTLSGEEPIPASLRIVLARG